MLWVPRKGNLRVQHNLGTVGSLTYGTSCTTGAAASTKGSFVEVFSSTDFDAWWVTILVGNYAESAADSRLAVDIGIGAATEEIIIADLLAGGAPTVGPSSYLSWNFPLHIPSGSRLAARGAGDRVSTGFHVGIILRGGDGSPAHRVGGAVTTYGMGTVPAGTTIVPGASGAEGSWTEIVASTSKNHFAFIPSFQAGLDTTKNRRAFFVDMGTGSATEEEMVGGDAYIMWTSSTEDATNQQVFPAFQDVPVSTRLVMRASCNSTLDSGSYNGVIHAIS